MFRCRNSQIYIHLGDLCNGGVDCLLGEDESFCPLRNAQCPAGCECLTFVISCYNLSLMATLRDGLIYRTLYVNQCTKEVMYALLRHILSVAIFNGTHNNLDHICGLFPLNFASLIINVSFNKIQIIERDCFKVASYLRVIKLNNNRLSVVKQKALQGLKVLVLLDLSDNLLSTIPAYLIFISTETFFLVFKNNSFDKSRHAEFKTLSFMGLYTDNYHLCCIFKYKVKCTELKPWYVSCSNMLINEAVRISIIIHSIISIIIHLKTSKCRAFSLTVSSIIVADTTHAIYVAILCITDMYYQDNFFPYELKWKSSYSCFRLFANSFNFNLLFPLLLCFLSFERLMIVMFPFETKFRDTKYIFPLICCLYGTSAVIIIILTTTAHILYNTVPLSICSPFVDPTNSVMLTKFITLLTVITQFIAVIFILAAHITMLKNIRKSRECVHKDMIYEPFDRKLLSQVIIVSGTNILCLIPSGTTYLLSMFLDKYPIDMIIWTTVAVTPINSIINLIVFIVTSSIK